MRFLAASALLLLLAIGAEAQTCAITLSSCRADLRGCRERLTVRISALEACTNARRKLTTEKSTLTRNLAVANQARNTCNANLATRTTERNTCNAALTTRTTERNTCQAALGPARTEITQTKGVQGQTMRNWGLSTAGKNLDDLSAIHEFIVANVKESPEFKEQSAVLNQLISGLNGCTSSNGGLLGTITGLLGCVTDLLQTLGL